MSPSILNQYLSPLCMYVSVCVFRSFCANVCIPVCMFFWLALGIFYVCEQYSSLCMHRILSMHPYFFLKFIITMKKQTARVSRAYVQCMPFVMIKSLLAWKRPPFDDEIHLSAAATFACTSITSPDLWCYDVHLLRSWAERAIMMRDYCSCSRN